jgi:hypothetical protein
MFPNNQSGGSIPNTTPVSIEEIERQSIEVLPKGEKLNFTVDRDLTPEEQTTICTNIIDARRQADKSYNIILTRIGRGITVQCLSGN